MTYAERLERQIRLTRARVVSEAVTRHGHSGATRERMRVRLWGALDDGCWTVGEIVPHQAEDGHAYVVHETSDWSIPVDRVFGDQIALRPLVALVESQLTGLSAGRGALARGYEEASIVVATSEMPWGADDACPGCGHGLPLSGPTASTRWVLCEDCRRDPRSAPDWHGALAALECPIRQVTIARATNAAGQVALDWSALRDALNWEERAHWQFGPTLDPAPGLWGGNPTSCILGSPKPAGTRLSLDAIVLLVCQHARWM